MRLFLTLAFAAVVLAFCAALFVLRGCQREVTPGQSASDVAREIGEVSGSTKQTPYAGQRDSRDREVEFPQPRMAPDDAAQGPPSSAATSQTPASAARAQSAADTAAEALATAQRKVAAAQRAAESDPGEAFRLYAEAYGAVSAYPGDAACTALAKSILPHLRNAAEQANASAGMADGKTLIEE